MKSRYQEVADLMIKPGGCVALTGAAISAESGIPTFRSRGGLWEKYDPNGAFVIEINPEKAFPGANIHIGEKAGTALPEIVEALDAE